MLLERSTFVLYENFILLECYIKKIHKYVIIYITLLSSVVDENIA